ncbi:DEAD/DEAH box helicase [uncultured Microbacterium sp.]|uniref:DEAD/DEAH box helicase n=1 Tax=uncultured Microbacterium sp. TaxID=191216 RepID=UPI002626BA9F|nr:DEAD/DEAH box helicase [uncultured Microbacterium sp.]
MVWSQHDTQELTGYVYEQQERALAAYEGDPDLIEEHVRQEDSYRTGGYGTRQISELMQNAVDALAAGGGPGRIEFRVAGGALYCANEGAPFAAGGLRAVTHAFLSGKRDDEIGRFGLGFKSVLGITSHPQIYSRSVSFEFNPERTHELLAGLTAPGGRLPQLRVPTLVDFAAAAAEDRHLAELGEWASTVVKLPLVREGARIREELTVGFSPESLVLLAPVAELLVSFSGVGDALTTRKYRRTVSDDGGTVTIGMPSGDAIDWYYAERPYRPSEEVAATLADTARRESMTVSYAVNPARRTEVGRLWAWFPLQDQTTAGGIFNAPWQVNDDRTQLLEPRTGFRRSADLAERITPLNRALLDVATDLFLDVVTRASGQSDPAAHLDLFPARGREIRSAADEYLSASIPERARQRRIVPDAAGRLIAPADVVLLPDLETVKLTGETVRLWGEAMGRADVPHESCFRTPARITRLRGLIGETVSGARGAAPLATWISAPAELGTLEGTRTSLQLLKILRDARLVGADADSIPLIPTDAGRRVGVSSARTVLLPVPGEDPPNGIECVLAEFAEDTEGREVLIGLGFRPVSQDQIVASLAAGLTRQSGDDEWEQFWVSANAALPSAASEALRAVRDRGVAPRVRTRAGTWRPAKQVFVDATIAQDIPERHVDADFIPSVSLLRDAGCLSSPRDDVRAEEETLFEEYLDFVYMRARKELQAKRIAVSKAEVRTPLIDQIGAGPVSLLTEGLTPAERTQWSDALVKSLRRSDYTVNIPIGRGLHAMVVPSLERWGVETHGTISTSVGARRPAEVVGSKLARLASFLPVVAFEAGYIFQPPGELGDVPDHLLLDALGRDGFPAAASIVRELLEEAASRPRISRPDLIPAIRGGKVVLSAPRDVVTASEDDLADVEKMGWAYVLGGASAVLRERWGIEDSQFALARSVEVAGVDAPVPLDELHPSLPEFTTVSTREVSVALADALFQVISGGPRGTTRTRVERTTREDGVVVVDRALEEDERLEAISRELRLGLGGYDIGKVLAADEGLRRSEVIERAVAARTDAERLLILVGVAALKSELPRGLLDTVENKVGVQSDLQVADLFLRATGSDAVYRLREHLKAAGIPTPKTWDGSTRSVADVHNMGFDSLYAGEREVRPPRVTQVPGRLELNPLHPYQQDLADQVRYLVDKSRRGEPQRGLLYLPTGAGKTRVTAEAILEMMRDGDLGSPVLWIAQSQELCEQAIQTFSEVWRWLGDERAIDLSRFWTGYDLDESTEEIQVVFAIDATLDSRLGESTYAWLRAPSLVVIDEAHTAGDSPRYTRVLTHLGFAQGRAERPLLGLTGTPFKGRNDETNQSFASRFGNQRFEPRDTIPGGWDKEDAIGELRRRRILSEIDHRVLNGLDYAMDDQSVKMREVSPAMLERIGSDISRTELVVDDIESRTRDWPTLVFMPSVAAAHTAAALLELRGIDADAVDGSMRTRERRRIIQRFREGESRVLVNCDLLTQGFDAPSVRALYIARPTFSPNRYIQMVGRGLRGPGNGGTERCLVVNVADTFNQFGDQLAFNEFDYLWSTK